MKKPFPTRLFFLGLGLVILMRWLWAWPYEYLRFYEANTAYLWSLAVVTPPLLGWLGWYSTRPGRTRSDFGVALGFVLIGSFILLTLAGTLHVVNAMAGGGGGAPLVRGTVLARHAPRRHKRSSRPLLPHTITVQLAGSSESVKLAVPNRPDIDRYPVGRAFAEPLRRGALGWWFAPKP